MVSTIYGAAPRSELKAYLDRINGTYRFVSNLQATSVSITMSVFITHCGKPKHVFCCCVWKIPHSRTNFCRPDTSFSGLVWSWTLTIVSEHENVNYTRDWEYFLQICSFYTSFPSGLTDPNDGLPFRNPASIKKTPDDGCNEAFIITL